MKTTLTFRAATEAVIPVLSELARAIWCTWYPAIISQEQIDYMLEKMYSAASLTEQMLEKHHHFHLCYAGEALIGYASVSTTDGKSYFLHKFYVDTEQHQRGVGKQLLAYLEATYTPEVIRLTVNRKNFVAINFYFRNGFVIESVEDFAIGNGFEMNDFVMCKTLV